jgi:2-C-methyl-D-erythritol 4-phosphate cytidylyltransferase
LRLAGCEVILVVPTDHLERARAVDGDVEIVPGGNSRQASVANGLAAVSTDLVLVHDAARPFVDSELIDALLDGLGDADGVVPVVPVHETVKEISGGDVTRTLDRERLALSQTPQLFKTGVLGAAHEQAASEGFQATDDAQLVEHSGGRIATVPGSRRNIKLTYPEDFEIAEQMVRAG